MAGPPLAQCGLQKVIVETLNKVGHHLAYRIEKLWTPCGVSYIVQCLHKDFRKAHIVQGGGPGHLCFDGISLIPGMVLAALVSSTRSIYLESTDYSCV